MSVTEGLLHRNPSPPAKSATGHQVKALTERHVADVRAKIRDLRKLDRVLSHLAAKCKGSSVPDCPILDALAGNPCVGQRTKEEPPAGSATLDPGRLLGLAAARHMRKFGWSFESKWSAQTS
jgi:hypothetical protein